MQSIINYIGVGQANAVKRRDLQLVTGLTDRALRETIAYEVNKNKNPVLNKQDGSGYYLSSDADEIDKVGWQEIRRGLSSLKRGFSLVNIAKTIRRSETQCQIKEM